MIVVSREDLDSPDAAALVGALNAELAATYAEPGATHFSLDAAEVAPGQGAFFVARDDGQPVGCGAVRLLDAQTAELKRMYVAPEHRGRGVGRALVAELEAEARRLGATRIVLETGVRQDRALALYRSCGFEVIPLYGEYVQSPETSVCMGKSL